jgi:hypothetical protein
MFFLITLPICLLAMLLVIGAAFSDAALRDRRPTKAVKSRKASRSPGSTVQTPIFVPSAMHACDSVRVMWY